MIDADTIVALSTPTGLGAIGVVRISGPQAHDIAEQCVKRKVSEDTHRKAVYSKFYADNRVLDEVIMISFSNPKSYTGEDSVEFSFHGSPYILNNAIQTIISYGARLAEPGEFSQRAFLNGKMDLSQAEAVADVINSESRAQHELAMRQIRGEVSQEINMLRAKLLDFASLIELELDFAEEDVEFANRDQLIALIDEIQVKGTKLVESFEVGNAIKNGVPVAIVGKPNVGKSTLLNALIGDERAIVSDIAGTTRDSIEDICTIGGIQFRFIDTAGLRETTDTIEAIGVKRSLQKIQEARIVIFLFEASESKEIVSKDLNEVHKVMSANNQKLIAVANKIDLHPNCVEVIESNGQRFPVQKISAKSKTALKDLNETLLNQIEIEQYSDSAIVSNARHVAEFKATLVSLDRAKEGVKNQLPGDLVASDIRNSLYHLGLITGEISTDDLLGNIFGKFCIGK